MKTAFGYLRDSGGPKQDRSVRDQRTELERWATTEGFVITRWYEDVARSGTKETRDEFQRMIADALREKPTAVVVWDFQRWARNQDAAAYYRALLRRGGVEVVSLNDPIPDGPMGRIVESVIDFSAEHFIATLRVNVKRGHRALLAQGFMPGSRPPLGFRAVKIGLGVNPRTKQERFGTRWEVDETVAPLIRQVFELRAHGASASKIVRETGLGVCFSEISVIVHNTAYRGVYTYGDEEWPILPRIVDDDLWQRAQVRIKLHPRTVGGAYLLTGLLRCEFCGYAMVGIRNKRQFKNGRVWERRYYICGARNTRLAACRAPLARADEVEADVVAAVFSSLLAPESFAAFVTAARAAEQTDITAHKAARLDAEIAQAEQQLRDLLDLLGRGVAVDVVAERLRVQEERVRELRRARGEVAELPRVLRLSEAELAAYARDLAERLATGDVQTKRWVLRELVAEIRYGERLAIRYKLPD